jgi:hypothetical protein
MMCALVSGNGFHSHDIIYFAKMLKVDDSRLLRLDLSDNNFGVVGMKEFGLALSKCCGGGGGGGGVVHRT